MEIPDGTVTALQIGVLVLGGGLGVFTVLRLRKRRGGVVQRLIGELGFAPGGDAAGKRLVGRYGEVRVTITLGEPEQLRLSFEVTPSEWPEGLRLRSAEHASTQPTTHLSFDGTVLEGPWRRWAELLDPKLFAELDTIGRYWRIDHRPHVIILSPLVIGVFEDYDWLVKTLDRMTALVRSARALHADGDGDARLSAHLAQVKDPDVVALYRAALATRDAEERPATP